MLQGSISFVPLIYDGLVGFAQQSYEMYRTGAAGAIFSSDTGQFSKPTDFDMPYVIINPKDGELVKKYMSMQRMQLTSMSCPHVAGIAALLKVHHHDWSSAAIRSAMMTTANMYDNANGIIIDMVTEIAGTPLDFGAGHVNPNKAMDPGLVYDIEVEDYINYFFNYKRLLTNVADGSSVYRAMVNAPEVSINLGTDATPQSDYIGNFGYLSWYEVNGKHMVRSPIVFCICSLNIY
ncbi:hypothetical protein JRO89_XS02G0071400 [Xanthoceras sorbifolium]|uniref:Peptidase S8/S53 domain-containing protein n=1 Tax=Xanthoceras sorbifolium TaxID=99658 RepID=A0ABQ8IF13_9ROSI|nr:hypothetical protein JRO89_XS02G0071400 [Xanthoceras sorbifolium]